MLDYLPHEVLCVVSQTLSTRDIKSLRCVCVHFSQAFSDQHMLDLESVKLYKHQLEGVDFLLGRESVGLNSILNFDTGTGKTAVVMYAYKKKPVPTVILIKKKLRRTWEDEMAKHGVRLDIINPSQITPDICKYKRIIMDEIHEPLLPTVNKCNKVADLIQGISVWGITASKLTLTRGEFRSQLLKRVFKTPDCIITMKLRELDTTIKSQFKLPNFLRIPLIDYRPLDNAYLDHVIVETIWSYMRNIRMFFEQRYQVDLEYYTYDVYYEYSRHYMPPTIVHREDGSFYLLGNIYTEFKISELMRAIYHWQLDNGMLERRRISYMINILTDYGKRRSIVYSNHQDVDYKGPFDIIGAHTKRMTYASRCDAFLQGDINVLVIPPHYSSGFNFGKIDVMIILDCHKYTDFHQMMGRINRLDQQNNTDVYVRDNFDVYVNIYRNEFV